MVLLQESVKLTHDFVCIRLRFGKLPLESIDLLVQQNSHLADIGKEAVFVVGKVDLEQAVVS